MSLSVYSIFSNTISTDNGGTRAFEKAYLFKEGKFYWTAFLFPFIKSLYDGLFKLFFFFVIVHVLLIVILKAGYLSYVEFFFLYFIFRLLTGLLYSEYKKAYLCRRGYQLTNIVLARSEEEAMMS